MLTVGVDLASQPKKTALCAINWSRPHAPTVTYLTTGAPDALIIAVAMGADRIAIDSPFGWPIGFAEFLTAHQNLDRVDFDGIAPNDVWFRQTDREMMTLKQPLSVAAEKLARTAYRCARLLQRLNDAGIPVDRSGSTGRIIETYPAAVLMSLGWDEPYKGSSNHDPRRQIAEGFCTAHNLHASPAIVTDAPGTLQEALAKSDDHLDSLICALVARADAIGHTHWKLSPDDALVPRARVEGWIHLPSEEAWPALNSEAASSASSEALRNP